MCCYDLTAMLLIATGSVTIVINAHTEQVEFTPNEIFHLLIEPSTIVYMVICVVLFVGETSMLRYFYKHLREFENDCHKYGFDMSRLLASDSLPGNNAEHPLLHQPLISKSGTTNDSINQRANGEVENPEDDEINNTINSQKPARLLIEILHNLDDNLLKQISSRSIGLKLYVKLPMLYLLLTAGL